MGDVELFDVQFQGGDAFIGDAKYFEKVDPKRFGFAVFSAGVGPGLAEKQCPGLDFVPIQTHEVLIWRAQIVLEGILLNA